MKMPWVTSSGGSPAGAALQLRLQPPHPADRLLEALAAAQLVGVGDLARLEPERGADRLGGFARAPHRAGQQAGDAELGEPGAGGARLLAAPAR